MHTSLKCADVITYGSTSNTGMNLQVHVITQGDNDLLNLLGQLTCRRKDKGLTFTELGIKLGKSPDGKGGSFTLSVGLNNCISEEICETRVCYVVMNESVMWYIENPRGQFISRGRVIFRVCEFIYTMRVTLFGLERWCYFTIIIPSPHTLTPLQHYNTNIHIDHIQYCKILTYRTRLSLSN